MSSASTSGIAPEELLLERYELLSPVGQGGFGTVYKARQIATNQTVAVKLLHLSKGERSLSLLARFQREMQLCARLHHPNIVRLIDSGQTASGRVYAVFEFVPGKTLREVLATEGALELREARHLMLQVLDALACAHRLGIVHRDLKPANIMVVPTGARRNALVLDFGIGAIIGEASQALSAPLTQSGEVVGTPAYAAPEQLNGEPPTPRSDIYAWGLIFLECLTGRPAMSGTSVYDAIYRHLSPEPVPLPGMLQAHPLGTLLQRATAKEPKIRPLTAQQLLQELESCELGPLGPSASRASGRPAEALAPVSGHVARTRLTHPLPFQPTRFVGRAREVATLRELLRRDEVRLVTLSGVGGSGKTRLALEVARTSQGAFPDGVCAVQLASVTDPALVIPTIARALGVREVPGHPLLESMKEQLYDRRLLLLLDNFEQLLPAAPLLSELLASCPAPKLLITSRCLLHIRFEREFPVPPLALPDMARQPSPEQLMECEAVRLFTDRVRDFNPEFTLNSGNVATVAEICQRLDGLPLAIELAAPRLRVLSLEALLARLGNRLSVLTGGARDLIARQQTLRATIEWSYNLLGPEERSLFNRLGVFAGGCSLADAEAVAGASGDRGLGVLDGLSALTSHSLIQRSDTGETPRFRMLESLREYALERLEASGEAERLRERHAARFLTRVEEAAPQVLGRHQRTWVQRLHCEAGNVRAALGFALERSDLETAGRIFQALLWFWISQGSFLEAREWRERVLAQSAPLGRARTRAKVLDAAGFLTIFLGDYAGALPLFEEARSIFLECGSRLDRASATMGLGVTSGAVGHPEGVHLMEEALGLAREGGDKNLAAVCLIALGENARFMQDYPRAGGFYEESLALLREAGNLFWTAYCLQNLAHVMLREGNWRRAAALLREALEIGREHQYVMVTNLYLAAMAGVALGRNEPRRAARLLGTVDTQLRRVGARFQPPDQNEHDHYLKLARTHLDATTFETAWAEGAAMTVDEAIAESLPLRT
jgi:predicted ATPase